MHTTIELLDLAKQRLALRHALPLPMTDYRLGKLLGVQQGTLSAWRRGKSRIDSRFASVFADACELPPEYVLACVEREGADDPKLQQIYESIAARFKAGVLVAAILTAGVGALLPQKSAFAAELNPEPAMYYANKKRRRRKRARQLELAVNPSRRGRKIETSITHPHTA